MDARRRTIALSQDGPIGNGGYGQTGIPIPGSMMKKPALRAPAARMSMAPGARVVSGGSSSQAAGAGLGSSQDGAGMRRSTMAPPPGARGQGLGVGPTPQSSRMLGGQGSVRRQSHFPSAGRPSVLPGSQKAADPRPIRTAAFQQACRDSIETFCRMNRCPVAMTEKTLVSPTAKDFYNLFKWLYNEFIDPAYSWPSKSLVDDITGVLRDLRYPGLDAMNKSAFSAPGDQRVWPLMLAMLSWLVDLAKANDMWQDPNIIEDPLLMPANAWPPNHEFLEDRLLWDYVSKMYVQWFRGEGEDFPEAEQELRDAYDRMHQNTLQDADELETLVQKRTVELSTLQAQEPPLKVMEEEYIRLKSDQGKFVSFIELHRQKADKIRQGIVKARSVIADHEMQLEAGRAELATIDAAVAAQNLSPDEVQRMNTERETLARHLEDYRQKIAEASQHSYDQEMAVTKLMDRFDGHLSEYTALAHSIGTILPMSDAPGALGPGGVDYTVDVELGVEDVASVQAHSRRLRQEIWPALQAYGEGSRREMVEIQNQHIQLDDEHDRLAQKVERQKDEAANLEAKLSVANSQAEDSRARVQAETSRSNNDIQRLENEVAQIQMTTRMGVQDVRSSIETTKIQFKELRHKTAALQDNLSREILSHVDVIVKAKEHASAQMQGVRTFAESTH